MADVLLKPAYVSAAADGYAALVQPSAWNAARLFSAGNDGEIVTRSAASATGAKWSASLTLSGGLAVGTTAAAPNGVEGYFVSTSASDPRGLMAAQYTTDATGARLQLRKGRGTEAVPTTIVTGDVLGRIRFSGYDSTTYLQMASIDAVSTGTIAATRVPTYLAFSVATDAAPSVLTEVLRLAPTLVTVTGAFTVTGNIVGNRVGAGAVQVIEWIGSTRMAAPADGKFNITNNAITQGFGFDTVTDAVCKVRTRAQTGYATVDALGYSVSGVAGASKAAGPVTSITVVNGIVTAIS
jgi:hypothetical protein